VNRKNFAPDRSFTSLAHAWGFLPDRFAAQPSQVVWEREARIYAPNRIHSRLFSW